MRRLAFLVLVAGALVAVGCSGGDAAGSPTADKKVAAPPSAGENKGKASGMSPDQISVSDAGKNADSRVGSAGKGSGN